MSKSVAESASQMNHSEKSQSSVYQGMELGEDRMLLGKLSGLVPFTYKGMPYSGRPELYGAVCKRSRRSV
jgi:hypothetical protein